jgi:hypothetical protein
MSTAEDEAARAACANETPAPCFPECTARAADSRADREYRQPQRRNSCSTSSSSIRTWRTIWLLNADSCFAPSPSRRSRAPPMV